MSRERSRKRPIASINVVPYIDVMLVLLIIFMVTAPLLTQGVKVDLPQTESPAVDSDKSEPVVVTIQKNGAIFMTNGDHPERSIAPKELQRRVTILMQRKPATCKLSDALACGQCSAAGKPLSLPPGKYVRKYET